MHDKGKENQFYFEASMEYLDRVRISYESCFFGPCSPLRPNFEVPSQ